MHWFVCTPSYTEWGNDYYEPPEEVVDCVSVDAPTKKQAKVEGVRELRKKKSGWMIPSENPFSGLKVTKALCPHGSCWCDICADKPEIPECAKCLAEWEAEAKEENA